MYKIETRSGNSTIEIKENDVQDLNREDEVAYKAEFDIFERRWRRNRGVPSKLTTRPSACV